MNNTVRWGLQPASAQGQGAYLQAQMKPPSDLRAAQQHMQTVSTCRQHKHSSTRLLSHRSGNLTKTRQAAAHLAPPCHQ